MILVTGGTGLVGSHLLMQLCKVASKPIIAIYRNEDNLKKTQLLFQEIETSNSQQNRGQNNKQNTGDAIKWVKADITDIPALEQIFQRYPIQQIYHCAALISFRRTHFEKLKKVNIEGTANLVNLSIDYKIQKLVYVSSIATLNLKPNQQVIDEHASWNSELDNSGYAVTKYGAEMEVWRGVEEGVPAVIIHPGVIIGETYRNGGSNTIFDKLKKGNPFYTIGKSGYVTVNDVANILVSLMNSTIKNERFVVVAENLEHKKVMDTVLEAYDKKKTRIAIPKFVLTTLAWFENILDYIFKYRPFVEKEVVDGMYNTTRYSSEKVTTRLGFSFEKVLTKVQEIAKRYKV